MAVAGLRALGQTLARKLEKMQRRRLTTLDDRRLHEIYEREKIALTGLSSQQGKERTRYC